jgi:hypothetical protein
MIDILKDEESRLSNRHLIAQNINNRTARIVDPKPEVSIFNFHYAVPSAVGDNYHLNRVISDDETGFAGQEPAPYRREAWQFFMAGGGILSHLDYSYSVDHPEGMETDLGDTPGSGGPELRRQFHILKGILESFELPAMQPFNECILKVRGDDHTKASALGNPGKEYALYIWSGKPGAAAEVDLGLPEGTYGIEWLDTQTGSVVKKEILRAQPGPFHHNTIISPQYSEDIAVKIQSRES